jgi:hypothetical protein
VTVESGIVSSALRVRNGDDEARGSKGSRKAHGVATGADYHSLAYQTTQDRAVCKTQAVNVFIGCLTKARMAAGTNEVAPESDKHEDAATGGIVLGTVVPFRMCPTDIRSRRSCASSGSFRGQSGPFAMTKAEQ